jgi:hypothetical protein
MKESFLGIRRRSEDIKTLCEKKMHPFLTTLKFLTMQKSILKKQLNKMTNLFLKD